LELPFTLDTPLLGVGAQMKNTIALAWGKRCVLSPHIGDLDSPRSRQVFEQMIVDMERLYGIRASALVADAHPGYASHRWARGSGRPLTTVLHHHAHASALYGEYWQETQGDTPWLVLTWDGVGYGADGTLWGGEALLGRPGAWQRFARLRPFRLPGGEKAARQPWRSAIGLCWEAGQAWGAPRPGLELLRQAWRQGLNSPTTTAAGRLFDAAAAILGLCAEASFEGQGPMLLEAASEGEGTPVNLPLVQCDEGVWQGDWHPLIGRLCDERLSIGERAADFHTSLAQLILGQAERAREEHGIRHIGLCGGVFQNRRLTEQSIALLQRQDFAVYTPKRLPGNDGGLAWGQIIEAASAHTDAHR
jgi:hydrogenase maturation protein HypF